MVQFLFILGKNWQFSTCELAFVLRALCPTARIVEASKTVCLVNFPKQRAAEVPIEDLQFYLGGIQKIAYVTGRLPRADFQDAFPPDLRHASAFRTQRARLEEFLQTQVPKIFGPVQPSRYFFAHSVYPEEYVSEFYKASIQHIIPFLTEKFEELLKTAGAVKVGSYRYPAEPLRAGTLNPIFPHHVLRYKLLGPTRAEIIWAMFPDQVVVGRTFTVTDPNYLQAIDEERPFRRFEGSLPPKYAKALLNFATQGLTLQPKERLQVYDPFCGSGTILLFGLLFEFDAYGSDIDPTCVAGTRANLAWYAARDKFAPQDWVAQVREANVLDTQNPFPEMRPHAIVTEPFLLPYYRNAPPARQVKADVESKVIPGYRALFQLASDVLVEGGRLCCTFPVVDTRERRTVQAFLSLQEMIPPTLEDLPLVESGSDTVSAGGFLLYEKTENISREIHLFQKKGSIRE